MQEAKGRVTLGVSLPPGPSGVDSGLDRSSPSYWPSMSESTTLQWGPRQGDSLVSKYLLFVTGTFQPPPPDSASVCELLASREVALGSGELKAALNAFKPPFFPLPFTDPSLQR